MNCLLLFQEASKITETQNVNDAIEFLKKQFWQYGTNEHKYNYTREEFKVQTALYSSSSNEQNSSIPSNCNR